MKKIILLIVVLGAIAGGWFLYFNNGSSDTAVTVCEAKRVDLYNTIEFSGKTAPKTMYSVMSETGGAVKSIHVSEGSAVNKGDSLFDLNDSEVQNLLKQAQVNYKMLEDSQVSAVMANGNMQAEKAKVALALSQTTGYDYESFNSAFAAQLSDNAAQTASALNAMDLSEATYTGGSLRLAELQVENLKQKLEGMRFSSLIKGTVISVNIHKGEVLSPGAPAMIIADTENLVIDAYVYEKDLGKLHEGMDVNVSADGEVFKGKITDIAKFATDTASQSNYGSMTKVEITPEKGFKKVPGADVDIEVVLSAKKNVLALPVDCLTEDGCVFVTGKGDKIEKRSVETGFRNTFYAEITSGVSEEEKVVLSPQNLKDGQKVKYDKS